MPDYQQGKIYAIRNSFNDKLYIGSTTTTLCRRFWGHKTQGERTTPKLVKAVNENPDGWDVFYIELLYAYPCSSKEELNAEEGKAIRAYNSIHNGYNTKVAGRTFEQWKLDEPERNIARIEQEREKRLLKKDQKKDYDRQYNAENREGRKVRDQAKIECECGMIICKWSKHRHLTTMRHTQLLNEKKINTNI